MSKKFPDFVITLVLPAPLLAQGAGQTKANTSAKTAESRLVVMPAGGKEVPAGVCLR